MKKHNSGIAASYKSGLSVAAIAVSMAAAMPVQQASAQVCTASGGQFVLGSSAGVDVDLDADCGAAAGSATAVLSAGEVITNGPNGMSDDGIADTTIWQLINNGSISGGTSGVTLAEHGSAVVNRGTITGLSNGLTLEGSGTVTNAGRIEGQFNLAIAFQDNDADNALELHPGNEIVGDIDAVGGGGGLNSGTDTLIFGGAGTDSFDVSLIEPDPDAFSTGLGARQYYGFDAFEKTGASTWQVTGANDAVNGDFTVRDGELRANAEIGGLAVLIEGGVVSGTGRLGAVMVAGGGVLRPGNSVGTIRVAGNADFQAGSIYRVHVDRNGASRTDIGGALAIDGGTVEAISLEADGDDSVAGTYRILAADGPVVGTFDGVTVNYAFLTPSLRYDARGVELILALLDLEKVAAELAETENQRRVATVLDSLDESDPRYDAFQNLFSGLNSEQVPGVLEGLSGSDLMAMFGAAPSVTAELLTFLRQTGSFGGALGQTAQSMTGTVQFASTADMATEAMAQRPATSAGARVPAIWTRLVGRAATLDRSGDLPGVDLRSAGLQAGIEAPVTETVTLGAALGFEQGRISSTGSASTDIDSYGGAVYGRYRSAPLRVSGAFSYSRTDHDISRQIPVFGTQSSSTSADVWGADVEAAYDLGPVFGGVTAAPLAGLRYTNVRMEGFTEDGTAGLTVAGFGSESLRTRLGVEGRLDGGTLGIDGLTVTGRAAWSHELASPSSSLRVSLLGSDSFHVEGQSLPRNLAEAGLSLDAALREDVTLFAAYEGQFGQGYRDHRGQAGLRLQW